MSAHIHPHNTQTHKHTPLHHTQISEKIRGRGDPKGSHYPFDFYNNIKSDVGDCTMAPIMNA